MTAVETVALFSGGLDSTTLLYHLREEGHKVRALSVGYGQRHSREVDHAREIARVLGIEWVNLTLTGIEVLLADAESSLVGRRLPVPEGHYADESMKATVVPNRNMFLLSIAGMWAAALDVPIVAYGAHAGDHPIYADCRPGFVESCRTTLELATGVRLYSPFIHMTKADIVRRGTALGVPYHLTYSCYKGGEVHCGMCGTCTERKEAFVLAGVKDPTRYGA